MPQLVVSFPSGVECRTEIILKIIRSTSNGAHCSVMQNHKHLLELLFLEQTSGVFVLYVEEIELGQIALSCHVDLDLLCYREGDSTCYARKIHQSSTR